MAAESTAVVLTERLDALAAALRAAGVSPEQSSGLLASAATATMHAVTLDALRDDLTLADAATAEPPAADAKPELAPVRIAA